LQNNFLTLDELLTIHQQLIEEFGGTIGVRDKGSLEAALMRPQSGYYQNSVLVVWLKEKVKPL